MRYDEFRRRIINHLEKYNPGNNEKTESQYSEFAQKYLKDTDHVKSVHWEDVEEFMTENFRSKFFVY